MFKENNFKPDDDFNFNQKRNWEKRDSEKVIKENMMGANYIQFYESNALLNQANAMGDDEMYGYNTKPWHSIIHAEELQNIQEELDSKYQLPDEDYVDEFKNEDSQKYQEIKEDRSLDWEESKEEAIILQDSLKTVVEGKSQNDAKHDINPINSEYLPQSIMEVAQKTQMKKKSEEESFEWNNFLIRRAWFRGLSVYFKNRFAKINVSWQRKRVNKKKKTPMHTLIREFALQEFGPIVERLNDSQWVSFRNTLYSILFSHRYKKSDDFLEGVDFQLIRGVLYSYTTESRIELMSNPFFSLAVSQFIKYGKEEFVNSKVRNKPKMYSEELKSELEALDDEANGWIKPYNFFE